MTAFGQAGQAPKVKPVSCAEFASKYARQRERVAI
jgi:hypothetical protein